MVNKRGVPFGPTWLTRTLEVVEVKSSDAKGGDRGDGSDFSDISRSRSVQVQEGE